MELFSTAELKKESHYSYDFMRVQEYQERMITAMNPGRLNQVVEAIGPNKIVHFVTVGDWSMHDLLAKLLESNKGCHLYLCTYAIRDFAILLMSDALQKKELLSVNLLIDYRAKVLAPQAYQLAQNNLTNIGETAVHAKAMVLQNDNCCITVLGSSNMTKNKKIETGAIYQDNALGEFYKNWIFEHIKKSNELK